MELKLYLSFASILVDMKTIASILFVLAFSFTSKAQTMFIDYSEHSGKNTAATHIMEARQTIESEEFVDILTAKQKLIRIIENYRTAGYEVKATSVSTHKHKKSYHYHYQYILQLPPMMDAPEEGKVLGRPIPEPPKREMRQKKARDGEGGASVMPLPGDRPGVPREEKSSKKVPTVNE
jgi:hypothetical protein